MDFRAELSKWGYNKGNAIDVEILIDEILPSLFFQKEEPKQETLEEASERIRKELIHAPVGIIPNFNDGFEQGAKWQQEQILDFLYEEITERRDYSASKMCEKVIEFIQQFKNK